MKITLTCALCGHVWTVTQWTPDAQKCPQCHGKEPTQDKQGQDRQRLGRGKSCC